MRLPDGHHALFPYFFVEDAPAFLGFLGRAFGAVEVGRTEHEGRIANARVRIGDVTFMVSEANERMGPMSAAYYLFTEDADKTFKSAVDSGAEALFEPMDMPYGDRQGGVKDPFGNLWFVSTRLVDGPYQD